MPATAYRIWALGPQLRKNDGTTIHYNVGVHALAKRSPINPFEVANEFICLNLGRAMNLPIPSGVPLAFNDELFFCSMIFAGTGQELPPCDTEELLKYDRRICCGIVVFDSWICNKDRYEKNLSFNLTTKEVQIFDHGIALLGSTGENRLDENEGSIAINRYNHCIALDIPTLDSFNEWEERIFAIPEYFIKEIARDAVPFGISEDLAVKCADFLIRRRERLRSFFAAAQYDPEIFPRASGPLFPILTQEEIERRVGEDDYEIGYYC